MGVFDSVLVPCPECELLHEFQSKSGECSLSVFTLENAPDDVLRDINRHAPATCSCGVSFYVDIPTREARRTSTA